MTMPALILGTVWLVSAVGAWWRSPAHPRFAQLQTLISWGVFGALLWVLNDNQEWGLALHAKLWLVALGGAPLLLTRRPGAVIGGGWLLVGSAGSLVGFGVNDGWMALGLGLVLLAPLLGLLRISVFISTLYSLALTLMLLHLSELLWGEALPLTLHLAMAAGWLGLFQLIQERRLQSALMTAAAPLSTWVVIFTLLCSFYPLTLLIDPGSLHPTLMVLPAAIFLAGVLTTRGFSTQLPYFKAIIVWAAFLVTALLPTGESELFYRATIVLIASVLVQLLGLRRASVSQRNVILIGTALLILVYLLGLQFRSLNIM